MLAEGPETTNFQGLKEYTKGRIVLNMSSFFHSFHKHLLLSSSGSRVLMWIDIWSDPEQSCYISNASLPFQPVLLSLLTSLLLTIVQFGGLVWGLLYFFDPPWSKRDERHYMLVLFTVWTVLLVEVLHSWV